MTSIRPAGHAYGCPKCGSDILKSAPLPIVGPLVNLGREMSRQFVWLVGVQVTTLITALGAIVGAFLMR